MPSSNLTLVANFTGGSTTTSYTLAVNREPTAGGTVSNNPTGTSFASGTLVTVTATPASGYTFTGWSGAPSSVTNTTNPTISFNISENVTLTAYFRQNSTSGDTRTDTLKYEAEEYTSKNGNNIQIGAIEDAGGGSCIGYIENGNSTTYAVTAPKTGAYTLVLRIASEQSISFSVTVNGTQVGTISRGGTDGWNTYVLEKFGPDVQLNAGENTVTLNFGGAVNVDYFLLIGEPVVPVSVRYDAPRVTKTRVTNITLTPSAKGFAATLPANHGFSSYKLIDLQGREIRSGYITGGTTQLKFNNLSNKALFLRLEGKNSAKTVVRAMTF
jgi:uncharacterized repeat protein (TIGR02543 family)